MLPDAPTRSPANGFPSPNTFPTVVHAGLSDEPYPTSPVPRVVGSLLHFTEIRSRFLPHPHDVIVCLPPDYALNRDRRYPVLYLHDGQNGCDDLAMLRQGRQPGHDLLYMEADGALHDERAWGERSGLFLRFLFPAMSSSLGAMASAMSSGMS